MLEQEASLLLRFVAENVLAVLAIRLLPFTVYAVGSSRVRAPVKAASLIAYATLVSVLCGFGPGFRLQFWEVCQGSAYFAMAALAFHPLGRAFARGHIGKVAVLAASAILFQLVPALSIRGLGSATVHVIGWELMLASYSYCIDGARRERAPSLREGLFFLLVNPVLVYSERGSDRCAAHIDRRVLDYVLLGLGGLLAQTTLHHLTTRWYESAAGPMHAAGVAGYASWAGYSAVRFLAIYAGMAGVANLQVGVMRSLGHEIPDRFDWPLLARNPGEFWARWNTYVAHWFERYLFIPVAKSKHSFHPSRSLRYSVATLATFLAVGLAHEYALLLQYGSASGAPTLTFALVALLVLGWKSAGRRVHASARGVSPSAVRWAGPALSRLVFTPLLLAIIWFALPALSGDGFPEPIARLWRQSALTMRDVP